MNDDSTERRAFGALRVRAGFGPLDVGWALGWASISIVAAGLLIARALGPAPSPVLTLLVTQACFAGIAWWALRRRGFGLRRTLAIHALGPRAFAGATSIGAGVVLVSAATTLRLAQWLGAPSNVDRLLDRMLGAIGPAGLLLLVTVLGPLAEELLFRGVVLRGLAPRFGPAAAIVIAAAAFACLHLHPLRLIATFLLGLACGVAAWHAGWWAAVVVHAINNLIVTVGFLILGDDPTRLLTGPRSWSWIGAGLFLLAVGTRLIRPRPGEAPDPS